jgi:hypothetical protein
MHWCLRDKVGLEQQDVLQSKTTVGHIDGRAQSFNADLNSYSENEGLLDNSGDHCSGMDFRDRTSRLSLSSTLSS